MVHQARRLPNTKTPPSAASTLSTSSMQIPRIPPGNLFKIIIKIMHDSFGPEVRPGGNPAISRKDAILSGQMRQKHCNYNASEFSTPQETNTMLHFRYRGEGRGGSSAIATLPPQRILKSLPRLQYETFLCHMWQNHCNCERAHHRTYLNVQCNSKTITSSECQASQPIEHAPNP